LGFKKLVIKKAPLCWGACNYLGLYSRLQRRLLLNNQQNNIVNQVVDDVENDGIHDVSVISCFLKYNLDDEKGKDNSKQKFFKKKIKSRLTML
jgi:hypothetical protein